MGSTLDGGGSVTIVGTALVDTGSRMDQVIFEEFKGTGNSELVLSRELAEARIWPAIDIFKSGTRKEALLYDADGAARITALRRGLAGLKPDAAMEKLLALAAKHPTNEDLLADDAVGLEDIPTVERQFEANQQTVEVVERDLRVGCFGDQLVGIAGVAGNGQRELVETIAGLRAATQGRIFASGHEITNRSPREIIEKDVCYVPGERLTGLVPEMSVTENLILKTYRDQRFIRGLFFNSGEIHSHADDLITRYDVTTPSRETSLKLLSGGNIQRVMLARETSGKPALLIAAHPTSGLDVGAIEYIWQLLLTER